MGMLGACSMDAMGMVMRVGDRCTILGVRTAWDVGSRHGQCGHMHVLEGCCQRGSRIVLRSRRFVCRVLRRVCILGALYGEKHEGRSSGYRIVVLFY